MLYSMSLEDETVEVATKPRRAPRKRVTTESSEPASDGAVVKKSAPRKKATVAKAEPVDGEPVPLKPRSRRVAAPAPEPVRKAPTPIAENKAATKTQRRQIIVVATLMIIGIGASAAIGYTDKGSINVEQTISTRNDQITSGEIQGEILSVQNTPQLPDGGLVGLGIGGPETNTPNASSTASSTEPVGQVPLTEAEAQAAAAAASSTAQ